MIFPDNLFTDRQYMVKHDFELYHYKNLDPLEVKLHHHDFNEIYILLSGNVEYFIEGIKYNLTPGDILLININELHRPKIRPGIPYERIVLFIRPEFIISHNKEGSNLSLCFESHYKDYAHLIHPENKMLRMIKEVLIKIFNLLNKDLFGADILKELYITEFLVYINQCFLNRIQQKEPAIIYNSFIETIISYINKNIDDDLSLHRIAHELFISKYYLSHYFKHRTGASLHRFIKYKRLLIARSLLKEGSTVINACHKCGFGDYNNFIRSFKKLYGVTPKKFLKSRSYLNPTVKFE